MLVDCMTSHFACPPPAGSTTQTLNSGKRMSCNQTAFGKAALQNNVASRRLSTAEKGKQRTSDINSDWRWAAVLVKQAAGETERVACSLYQDHEN
jgi:DNA-binding IclR family transcriptional regulator